MQNLKTLLPYQSHCRRFFSTSLPLCRGPPYRTVDEVLENRNSRYKIYPHKVLCKLLFMKKRNQSIFWNPPVAQPSISLQTAASCVTPTRVASSRRVLVLHKLFMRYIPELLATSEFGMKLYGHDVKISHVKLSGDYRQLKVYWLPKGTDADEEVQKLLDEAARPLRQELINLRVMGIVPVIRFDKDKFHALMAEVDRRLKIADFGENFVPTIFEEDILKRQLQLQATLPVEIKDDIMKLENQLPLKEDEEMEVPAMRMNVLGLNYELIQKHIADGIKRIRILKKSKANTENMLGVNAIKEVPFDEEARGDEPLSKKAIYSYIRKQKQERKKMLKEQAKDFKKQALLDSAIYEGSVQAEEDELFTEFVKNAFEDTFEDFDDDDKFELEQ